MDQPTPAAPAAPAATPTRQVLLQKIYLRDVSLEIPQAPDVFTRQWQPELDVQVSTELQSLSADTYQVTVSTTVTAKLGTEIGFLVEVKQAGIFVVRGFDNAAEKAAVLGGYCPGLIFPFARESIADLVQRAGFPQLLLQPINFEALYLEHQARQQQAAANGTGAPASAH
ncbi:MAG TPA: protein-export chaperone SecB [Solimonas sp.]|nr:protein-export chaperone SecB [Solimonas sp.]